MEEVGVDSVGSPKPAVLGGPQPKVGGGSGMGIEPTEIGMIQPTVGVRNKGRKPRGGVPSTGDFRNGFPPRTSGGEWGNDKGLDCAISGSFGIAGEGTEKIP